MIKRFTAISTDTNQPEILEGLRAIGVLVWYIGWPLDLLCAYRGVFYLLEVKMPGTKPSQKQKEVIILMENCGCPVYVVYNLGDALRAIGAIGKTEVE